MRKWSLAIVCLLAGGLLGALGVLSLSQTSTPKDEGTAASSPIESTAPEPTRSELQKTNHSDDALAAELAAARVRLRDLEEEHAKLTEQYASVSRKFNILTGREQPLDHDPTLLVADDWAMELYKLRVGVRDTFGINLELQVSPYLAKFHGLDEATTARIVEAAEKAQSAIKAAELEHSEIVLDEPGRIGIRIDPINEVAVAAYEEMEQAIRPLLDPEDARTIIPNKAQAMFGTDRPRIMYFEVTENEDGLDTYTFGAKGDGYHRFDESRSPNIPERYSHLFSPSGEAIQR